MSSLCPNKDRCGSCAWSHIPYEKQLKQKLSDINGSFKLKKLGERVFEILPSPQTEHYRNRMDFVIDFEGRVGMREKGKWWKVIDNHVCFLGMERIEELFMMVRDWTKTAGLSFYDRKAGTGLLRYAVIRATTTDEAMVIIVTSKPELGERETLRKTLDLLTTSMTSTTSLIHSVNETISDVSFGTQLETISGSGFMEEVIADCRFRMTPNAFFQTNPYAAPMLLNTVREFAGDLSGKTVLDLYCGSGFFGIGLARFHLTPRVYDSEFPARMTASPTESFWREVIRSGGRRQSPTATTAAERASSASSSCPKRFKTLA
ncbi:MAG: 23S rRNA (Uracil-5-)-methyltransferase [Candidatus Uhrbacteria bacterium GW2011_GWC2_53_7]|uniref:23S rRNA (Uracil-5-)-methyltransferase n=1 Tax=Candidatus Uhrbacteria bacterium GW2011_GWC2_53_7 TaxID=1618986 RepID=A0A0G1XWP3_9BACT|nr:MAG: 23S rRNA (Uracil-5-)-methyltransferase [Candidatus Uhrbacteria bacterium GW2011_GWC2_53_7]